MIYLNHMHRLMQSGTQFFQTRNVSDRKTFTLGPDPVVRTRYLPDRNASLI